MLTTRALITCTEQAFALPRCSSLKSSRLPSSKALCILFCLSYYFSLIHFIFSYLTHASCNSSHQLDNPRILIPRRTSTTMSSKCYLLTLPRELRDWIYSYVLVFHSPQEIPLRIERAHTPSHLALLQTCHQINEEASPIFYTTTVFERRINTVSGPSSLTGIAKSSFHKMRHFRLVLDYKIPDLDLGARDRDVLHYGVNVYDLSFGIRSGMKAVRDFEKPMSDHLGIDTLTVSNFTCFTAYDTLQESGEFIKLKYWRTIEEDEYELRRPIKRQKVEASEKAPRNATIEYHGELNNLEENEARLKSTWEPFLRLRPKRLNFEGLTEERPSSGGLRERWARASERRWSRVPRWLVMGSSSEMVGGA